MRGEGKARKGKWNNQVRESEERGVTEKQKKAEERERKRAPKKKVHR